MVLKKLQKFRIHKFQKLCAESFYFRFHVLFLPFFEIIIYEIIFRVDHQDLSKKIFQK